MSQSQFSSSAVVLSRMSCALNHMNQIERAPVQLESSQLLGTGLHCFYRGEKRGTKLSPDARGAVKNAAFGLCRWNWFGATAGRVSVNRMYWHVFCSRTRMCCAQLSGTFFYRRVTYSVSRSRSPLTVPRTCSASLGSSCAEPEHPVPRRANRALATSIPSALSVCTSDFIFVALFFVFMRELPPIGKGVDAPNGPPYFDCERDVLLILDDSSHLSRQNSSC